MRQQLALAWDSVMDSRYNPLRHMDLASGHYLMQVLAWMWSMVFSLSFLSIYYFSFVWLGHLLVIGGVFLTLSLFERAEMMKREATLAADRPGNPAFTSPWQNDRD